jgi:hypothetical protein
VLGKSFWSPMEDMGTGELSKEDVAGDSADVKAYR